MQNNIQKKKIEQILSFLSSEDLKKDIVEIDIKDPKNIKLIEYLETIGNEQIEYDIPSKQNLGSIQELGRVTNLWYKDINGNWTIKLWEIYRFKP